MQNKFLLGCTVSFVVPREGIAQRDVANGRAISRQQGE